MKFRVLAGCHREGKKVYQAGDIVESNRDLSKAFKNKFELVAMDIEATSLQDESKKIIEGSPPDQSEVVLELKEEKKPKRILKRPDRASIQV